MAKSLIKPAILTLLIIIIVESIFLVVIFLSEYKKKTFDSSVKKQELLFFINNSLKPNYQINKLGDFTPSKRRPAVANFLTSIRGNPVKIGYTSLPNRELVDKYIIVEEDGFVDYGYETVMSVFKKYFIIPNVPEKSWKQSEVKDGVTTYEYVYPVGEDGSYETRTAYIYIRQSGYILISVAACIKKPQSTSYNSNTCTDLVE